MIELTKLNDWTPDAIAAVKSITSKHEWPAMFEDVRSDMAGLFQYGDKTYAVLRVEPRTRDLVVAALVGEHAAELMGAAVRIARKNALTSVLFITQRKGLARLLSAYSPVEQSTVYRVAVA